MKKNILTFAAVLLAAVMLTACSGGSKETEPETTAEVTEAVTEAVEEEPELDSLNGTVTKIDGDEVTVLNSDDDNEYRFDISEAEIIRQYPLSEGDEVYVEYIAGNLNPKTATIYEVEEPYLASTMDPYLDGTVTDTDDDEETVTIETSDGNEYTFFTADAYIVTESGINPGVQVEITYLGEPDDEPYAIKIVTEDSFGTPDAEKNGLVGTVADIDDGQIVLISGDDDYFTFVSDSINFDNYDEGDRVLIIYSGLITDKEIPALQISLY